MRWIFARATLRNITIAPVATSNELNLRVVGGPVDRQQREHIRKHVRRIEPDHAVREVLITQFYYNFILVV